MRGLCDQIEDEQALGITDSSDEPSDGPLVQLLLDILSTLEGRAEMREICAQTALEELLSP